jgi:peptidoglycan/xylan/chitin deacetylase (PgdA/CDA1 family)
MDYLKTRGYSVVTMQNVVDFFDNGTPLPSKPVLLSFDDGYNDFYINAYPILKARGFPATLFLPTGLTNNIGYVSWDEVKEMSSNAIEIANHTWSHKSMKREKGLDDFEIHTADVQLGDRGLNNPKVFAYPYGEISKISQDELVAENYKLAFTTRYGTVLCKKQRLELPRVRIGSASLGNYGI